MPAVADIIPPVAAQRGGAPRLVNRSTSRHLSVPVTCWKGNRCRRSTCSHCSYYRGFKQQKQILDNLSKRRLFRLVLTIKSGTDLKERTAHLFNSGTKLRRSKFWKRSIKGGYFRLHVDSRANNWQPHFDCLLEAENIDSSDLRQVWYKITGDSFIIDVQPVQDSELDRYRLTRYQLKPSFKQFANRTDLVHAYAKATRGKRKLQRFGSWLNTKNDPTRWKVAAKPAPVPETVEPISDPFIDDLFACHSPLWGELSAVKAALRVGELPDTLPAFDSAPTNNALSLHHFVTLSLNSSVGEPHRYRESWFNSAQRSGRSEDG